MSKWSAWPAEPIKDLSEIRRRHARDESRSSLWDNNPYVMHRDREWLLAEIKRLRAEAERLRGEMPVADSLRIAAECAQIERDEARAVVLEQAKENADLRAEVERLRAALEAKP